MKPFKYYVTDLVLPNREDYTTYYLYAVDNPAQVIISGTLREVHDYRISHAEECTGSIVGSDCTVEYRQMIQDFKKNRDAHRLALIAEFKHDMRVFFHVEETNPKSELLTDKAFGYYISNPLICTDEDLEDVFDMYELFHDLIH